MGITHAYAGDITKAERDANGDLIVYGKATGPDLDLDEQVCDPGWLKSAMPEWMTWGNLREMHQPIAAGVGMELSAQGDDYFVKSQVVDEGTAKKIEAGALKGYSVGIKNAKVVKDATAPGGRIVGGSIVEVSYVDRPCNPTATLAIAKAVGADTALAPVEKADASDEDTEQDDAVVEETGTGKTDVVEDLAKLLAASEVQADELKAVRSLLSMQKLAPSDRDKAIALVKAVGPDGQIDETPDIAGGKEAIALIAKLIGYEADELAAGELDEACDISLLVSAVECLKCWLAKEQGTEEPMDDVSYVALDAEADTTKTTDAAPAVSKDEIADLVKAAVTEATKAQKEEQAALRAELAKVKARPIPGGPVITAANPRRQTDTRADDLHKAAYFEHMATQVQDPLTADGYRRKAAELRQRHAEQSH